jgi:hypothetical protein
MWLLLFSAHKERSREQVLLTAQPHSDLLVHGLFIADDCEKKSDLSAPNHKSNILVLMEVIIAGEKFTLSIRLPLIYQMR